MFLIVGIYNLVIAFHIFVFLIQEIIVMANSFISAIPLQPTPECIKLSLLQIISEHVITSLRPFLPSPRRFSQVAYQKGVTVGALPLRWPQRSSQGEWCKQSA